MEGDLRLLLGGVHRAPERAWIDPVRVEIEHRIKELASDLR
jgi:hypothetical protein